MGFSTGYDNIPQGGDIVPEGVYECIITNAEVRQTKNGKYKVGFMLTIRNDVQQPCSNRVLFLDIWRKKEPNDADNQVDGFNFAQLMAVSRAAQIPSGQSFESLEQFLGAMVGRLIVAEVYHDTYNGNTTAKVDPLETEPTRFPECRHVQKQRAQTPAYGSVAQRPPQQFAAQPQYAPAPQSYAQQPQPYAPPPSAQQAPGEYETILSDGQVPF